MTTAIKVITDVTTVADAAKRAGLTHQQFLNRIHRNKIAGAYKSGGTWLVPVNSIPKKKRTHK